MAATLSTSAVAPEVKHSGESILFAVDFTKLLVASETLTGTPTVTKVLVTTPDLTITSPIVNVATFLNDNGQTVAIGAGVQVRLASGLTANDYVLTVKCATSAGNTRTIVCTLQVRDT